MEEKALNCLHLGGTAIVKRLECAGEQRRRFLDLGIVSGTKITALFSSPFKDPTAYLIRGAVIALRDIDCKRIIIY